MQVLVVNGIIMVSQAHNMCKPGLDPIDCKSSLYIFVTSEDYPILEMNINQIVLLPSSIHHIAYQYEVHHKSHHKLLETFHFI